MPQQTITVIGSLNADLVTITPRIPIGGETLTATSFNTHFGGKGANQAVACARLSRPDSITQPSMNATSDVLVRIVGHVGADDFGTRLIAGLTKNGIDTERIRIVHGQKSGVAVILVEEELGQNRILLSTGANYSLRPEDIIGFHSFGEPKPDLVVLQLEIPLETVLRILEVCKQADIDVLLNAAPAMKLPDQVFGAVKHLVVNESEAAFLSGRTVAEVERDNMDWSQVTDEFLAKGVKHVVITLGSKGAWYSSSKGTGFRVTAHKGIKVKDTTAAGDTFVGAYAVLAVRRATKAEEWNIMEAVKWACKAAGMTTEKMGAQSSIPWASEVLARS